MLNQKSIKVLLEYLEADEAHLVVCGLAELLAEGEDETLLLVPLHQGQHAQNAVQHTLHLHIRYTVRYVRNQGVATKILKL